jgi:hypothetical protein
LPRPRTAYQASLDIAAGWQPPTPGNSSLDHERQLLAHELGQLNRAIDSTVTAIHNDLASRLDGLLWSSKDAPNGAN